MDLVELLRFGRCWTLDLNTACLILNFDKQTSSARTYCSTFWFQVYVTDLVTRESTLLCLEEQPVLQLALQGDDSLWVATTDSSLNKWPAREKTGKTYQRASSFVAGSLPFARARACIDGSAPVRTFFRKNIRSSLSVSLHLRYRLWTRITRD